MSAIPIPINGNNTKNHETPGYPFEHNQFKKKVKITAKISFANAGPYCIPNINPISVNALKTRYTLAGSQRLVNESIVAI